MENRIGLIAGNGRLPLIFAKQARKKGIELIVVAIKEEASKDVAQFASKIYWVSVGELERLSQILLQEKLTSVVMAGQVRHKLLFDKGIKIDAKMQQLLDKVKDKKTDSLIGAVAERLEVLGVRLLDSTLFLSDYLPEKGVLTKHALDERILEDIEFGRGIAKSLAGLDIGQTVVVKEKTILAVESIEGTDEAIKRGAHYGRAGVVVIKVSKPNQDMRFDVPIIGPDTIRLMKEVKASCIAIEAGKTLIIDKEDTIYMADNLGIGIVAA